MLNVKKRFQNGASYRPPRRPNFHNFRNFLRFLPKVLIFIILLNVQILKTLFILDFAGFTSKFILHSNVYAMFIL